MPGAKSLPSLLTQGTSAGTVTRPCRYRPEFQGRRTIAVIVLMAALLSGRAEAWIYSEHRDIMAEGLRDLSPEAPIGA